MYRYWNQVHTKHANLFSILVESEQKQDRINAIHRSKDIYLSVYLYFIIKLLVCVKDSVCLRIAIPAYCINIFGSIFGILFCLLIGK